VRREASWSAAVRRIWLPLSLRGDDSALEVVWFGVKCALPISLLLLEGDYILDAAEAQSAEIDLRLPDDYVVTTRDVMELVSVQDTLQKTYGGSVGTLTIEQDASLELLMGMLSRARRTAKRAFSGQTVKLRQEFQVGASKPGNLATVLQRARIIAAGLGNAENVAPLTAKGWQAADTEAVNAAIHALDTTDDTQEQAKITRKGTTGERNRQANDLYERLLTIQNAANLQWPSSNRLNEPIRASFRLGTFPPRRSATGAPSELEQTPEPAQPVSRAVR
jgi:hypothetical protein